MDARSVKAFVWPSCCSLRSDLRIAFFPGRLATVYESVFLWLNHSSPFCNINKVIYFYFSPCISPEFGGESVRNKTKRTLEGFYKQTGRGSFFGVRFAHDVICIHSQQVMLCGECIIKLCHCDSNFIDREAVCIIPNRKDGCGLLNVDSPKSDPHFLASPPPLP
jgi:hypothetical protein